MSKSLRKRVKRSQSISEAKSESDEIQANGTRRGRSPQRIPVYGHGTKKCHESRDSLFSSKSGFVAYRGFLNLCVILLAVSNARLFLENVLKYGILVDPLQWVTAAMDNPYQWPNAVLMFCSNIFIILAFYIEVSIARGRLTNYVGSVLHILNLILLVLIPPVQILMLEPNPIGSIFSCGTYAIVFLKLWSYAQTNSWYRDEYTKVSVQNRKLKRTSSLPSRDWKQITDQAIEVKYPYNLTLRNLYYFMFAPTLCYELNYPRTERIRKRFLLRRVIEALFLLQLELALCQQWIVPTLQKAIDPIHKLDATRMFERLLKLSIPNHLMWLIFFYWFFHSVLNVLAELLRFADREFYRDWWNSETIVYFWQAWNIPVHKWCTRHVYKPLLRCGYSKIAAQLIVFLLSAFFHEYLVSVPLHMFKLWAFSGMVAQIPLAALTNWMSKRYSPHYGNMVVWTSLIIGQPMAVLAYVYYYYVLRFGGVSDQIQF